MKRILTCINCPLGCQITVELEGREVKSVIGNTCKRGEGYARQEVIAPVRMVTTTVRVKGGTQPVVPVKTSSPIPKEKVRACVQALAGITVKAPVRAGETVARFENFEIISTKNVEIMCLPNGKRNTE